MRCSEAADDESRLISERCSFYDGPTGDRSAAAAATQADRTQKNCRSCRCRYDARDLADSEEPSAAGQGSGQGCAVELPAPEALGDRKISALIGGSARLNSAGHLEPPAGRLQNFVLL